MAVTRRYQAMAFALALRIFNQIGPITGIFSLFETSNGHY